MAYGCCGSLRYTDKRVRSQNQGIDHRLQITLESCEGNVDDVPIREAKASTIIANELKALGEKMAKRCPDGTMPVALEVAEPGRNEYERRSFPNPCYREIDAIFSPTKRDLLPKRHPGRRPLVETFLG